MRPVESPRGRRRRTRTQTRHKKAAPAAALPTQTLKAKVEQQSSRPPPAPQLVVAPVVRPDWVEVEMLDATDRGEGGFGHTGTT